MAAALATALLLHLAFPVNGPMSAWRSLFAWLALTPWLVALLRLVYPDASCPDAASACPPLRPLWAFLSGWLCGAVWFAVHCSWVDRTMHLYGGMGSVLAAVSLVLFSLFLGVWFGVFAFAFVVAALALRRRGFTAPVVCAAAPVLWVATEFALARVPSFPWDELGYTQIDNGLLTLLAPWTGVLGISFVLAAASALLAAAILSTARRRRLFALWLVVVAIGLSGFLLPRPAPEPTATAMLVQPNLNVATDDVWLDAQWKAKMAQFARLAADCGAPYYRGLPGATPAVSDPCAAGSKSQPDLIAWPESPAPFRDIDPRFRQAMADIATQTPLVVGDLGIDISPGPDGRMNDHEYNSASVVAPGGAFVGRYDKIHLVPFGEYVPARELLFFVRQITAQLTDLNRGTERRVFRLARTGGTAHRYGIFLCYESIFGDEVRPFVQLGAEVLVNLSDDGWYGDTDAPWQHLTMTRMRAVENDRWLLLDTNNGITAVIDPRGVVRQSIARDQVAVLPAHFGLEQRLTWYTTHGDLLAIACAILSMVLLLWSTRVLVHAAVARQPSR